MKKSTTIAVAGLFATLLPLGAAQADTCVWLRNLDDFKPANDEKSLIVSDTPSHKYTVTLMGRCMGLRFAEAIAVRSVGGMFCLEPGDAISFNDGGLHQRCTINKIAPFTAPKPGDAAPATPGADTAPTQPQGY